MAYKVEYAGSVEKDLKRLPHKIKIRALNIVEQIVAKNPSLGRPLVGPYKGLFKYRIGDYRIVYSIEKDRLVVFVLRIRHRKDVYRGLI